MIARRVPRSCPSKLFAPAKLNLWRAVRSREGAEYLAGGLALGAFWLWTPILVLHFPVALITAHFARVSKLAALSMVLVSNPLTLAPIQFANFLVGASLTRGSNPDSPLRNPAALLDDPVAIFNLGWHDYFTLSLGSLVLGTVTSLIVWGAARRWAWGMARRRQRRHARQRSTT